MASVFAFGLLLPVSGAGASTNVVYILDGSNSMWGQIDGVAKITTAKAVMSDLLANSPDGVNLGLLAYGHRSEGQCDDIEVLKTLGPKDAAALTKLVNSINPKGKTPIGASLLKASELLGEVDANNSIVLVSDGVETCKADPCAVSASIARKGIHTKVHVVGFDIGKEERAELQCIADKGHGKYYGANNADELKQAFVSIEKEVMLAAAETEVAPQSPPPAPEPKWVEVFRDDFDGSELSDKWTVTNPNPDAYIIENGELLIIANKLAQLSDEKPQNLFGINIDLPKGDYEVEVVFSAEFNTGAESLSIALLDDPKNYLAATNAVVASSPVCENRVVMVKNSNGDVSSTYEKSVWWNSCDDEVEKFMTEKAAEFIKGAVEPVTLKLVKSGRTYRSAFRFASTVDEDKKPRFIESSTVSSLRAPKGLYLLASQAKKVTGETLFKIDSIVVRELQATEGQ